MSGGRLPQRRAEATRRTRTCVGPAHSKRVARPRLLQGQDHHVAPKVCAPARGMGSPTATLSEGQGGEGTHAMQGQAATEERHRAGGGGAV